MLASLGRKCAVVEIYGCTFSGFFAWWLWRTIYLLKLPGLERKIRVALDWTLDLFFSRDIALLKLFRRADIERAKFRVEADDAQPENQSMALIGVEADTTETEYGWIEPGKPPLRVVTSIILRVANSGKSLLRNSEGLPSG